jgi:hypothetical protein
MSPLAHLHADPTRVSAQPALETTRRRQWIVPAGVLAVVAVAVFALTLPLNPAIALTGIILITAFYTAMIVCAVAVANVKNRNLAFAWLMGGMSVVSTVLLLFLLAIEQFD